MRIHTYASILSVILLCGCESPSGTSEMPTQGVTTQFIGSQNSHWPVPENLSIYGMPSENDIRAFVFGEGAGRPGIYYLPANATVRSAIKSAGGNSATIKWAESGLERWHSDGSSDVIHFSAGQETEMQIPLQDGDRIYLAR